MSRIASICKMKQQALAICCGIIGIGNHLYICLFNFIPITPFVQVLTVSVLVRESKFTNYTCKGPCKARNETKPRQKGFFNSLFSV